MNTNANPIERFALSLYLILTPLVSLIIALFVPLPVIAIALLLIFIPASLAVLLTALTEGRDGVTRLLKKLVEWRVSFKGYALAILIPVGIILAAGVLAFLFGWAPDVRIYIPAPSQLLTNLVLILLIAVLEELGWRGYALPKLLENRSPLTAAVITGVAWGALHLGIGSLDGRPLIPTFLVPFGLSFVLTWLFVQTRGSLTMAVLLHFAVDYLPQFMFSGLTVEQALVLQVIVIFAFDLLLVVVSGPNLQRTRVKREAILNP